MGVGVALAAPAWRIQLARSSKNTLNRVVPSDDADTAERIVMPLLDRLGTVLGGASAEVTILESIEPHVGLGSHTSLACGVIAAYCHACGRGADWPALRGLSGRGGTSGAGVNLSVTGGAVLDHGHYEPAGWTPSPSRARNAHAHPGAAAHWPVEPWETVLVRPIGARRCFGLREQRLFDRHAPVAARVTERIASVVLCELVPGLATRHYESFVGALRKLQDLGFKLAEWEEQDGPVRNVRDDALELGADVVALSSVGPTCAVFGRDLDALERGLRSRHGETLELRRARLSNSGVAINSEVGVT